MAMWAAVGSVVIGALTASSSQAATESAAAAQERIASRQLRMAEALQEYWRTTFKPQEMQQLADAVAGIRRPYVPRYEETAGRMMNSVRISFQGKLRDALRCNSRYCCGMSSKMVKDFAIAEAMAVASARNYAYRYEEARAEAKEDRAWSRRENAINLGRGLRAESATYSRTAAGMYGTLGQQAAAAAAGSMKLLGYGLERLMGNSPGGNRVPNRTMDESGAGMRSNNNGATNINVNVGNQGQAAATGSWGDAFNASNPITPTDPNYVGDYGNNDSYGADADIMGSFDAGGYDYA